MGHLSPQPKLTMAGRKLVFQHVGAISTDIQTEFEAPIQMLD